MVVSRVVIGGVGVVGRCVFGGDCDDAGWWVLLVEGCCCAQESGRVPHAKFEGRRITAAEGEAWQRLVRVERGAVGGGQVGE
jgi:hypothetical protein